MNVTIGAQGSETQYALLVDSGSSNTWIGNNKPYVKTSTSKDTGLSVSLAYGSGNMTGEEYTDRVSLAPGLTIERQSIGVANYSNLGNHDDGLIGLAPVGLTVGTLSNKTQSVPTVQNNLYNDGTIDKNVIGIAFAPTSIQNDNNGQITFGGVDNTKFIGLLNYVNVTTRKPASEFWGLDASARYGNTPLLVNATAIVDTGTTLHLFSTGVYDKILAATGAVLDKNTGLPMVTQAQYEAMKSLYFTIGSQTYELIPDAIRWPKAFNTAIGGTADAIYLAVESSGLADGTDIDIYLGMLFHERYYIELDSGSKQIDSVIYQPSISKVTTEAIIN
ncbi:hypothetical protein Unana1_02273 [Umbelopsis nana]